MKRFSTYLLILLFGLVISTGGIHHVEAAPLDYDVSVTAQSPAISFSPSTFYAGEPVRIYGLLSNIGNRDVSGLVAFFQGPSMIGGTQAFSSRVNGAPEEVWVDWTPTEGTYNISFRILSATPTDQDLSNNQAVSPMMTITVAPPPPAPAPAPTPTPTPSPTPGGGSGSGSGSSGTGSTSPTPTPTPRPSTSPSAQDTTTRNTAINGTSIETPSSTTDGQVMITDGSNNDTATGEDTPYAITTAPVEDSGDGENLTAGSVNEESGEKKSSKIPFILSLAGLLAMLMLISAYVIHKKSGKKNDYDNLDL